MIRKCALLSRRSILSATNRPKSLNRVETPGQPVCMGRTTPMKGDNPEDHDRWHLPARDKDPISSHSMRISSPLSVDEERSSTRSLDRRSRCIALSVPGFLVIYRKAMCIELGKRSRLRVRTTIEVTYDAIPITGQRIDLIVGGLIVVELKAVARLEEIHRAQLISYLRTTGMRGGLLINFPIRVLKEGLRRISDFRRAEESSRPYGCCLPFAFFVV